MSYPDDETEGQITKRCLSWMGLDHPTLAADILTSEYCTHDSHKTACRACVYALVKATIIYVQSQNRAREKDHGRGPTRETVVTRPRSKNANDTSGNRSWTRGIDEP